MRRVILIGFVLTFVALIAGGVVLLQEFNRTFPAMRPGVYAGTLVSKEGEVSLPWLVEVAVGSSDVSVSVGDSRLPAQRAAVVESSSGTRLPLVIMGSERRLRVTGRAEEEGIYQGDYSDPISGEQGIWNLKRFEIPPLDKGAREDLLTWATAWRTLQVVEGRIEEGKKQFDATGSRIEKLHRHTVEDDSLQKVAESRFARTSSEIEVIQRSNLTKRAELDQIIKNIEIAKAVSPEGQLIALSRESIQREGRWIEQALKIAAPEVSPDFEDEYERARKVKALQDQISEERELIKHLAERPQDNERRSETESEEEFYRGLQ